MLIPQVSVKNHAKECTFSSHLIVLSMVRPIRDPKVLCLREYTGQEHHYLTINPPVPILPPTPNQRIGLDETHYWTMILPCRVTTSAVPQLRW